jgi:hypothetical protein
MLEDLGYLAPALATLAFFGGIALIVLASQYGQARKRELEHVERLKALDLGQPLPDADIAWANAESARTNAAAAVAVFVPLVLVAGAVGGSALILGVADPRLHLPLLCIIWGVSGLASLLTVIMASGALCLKGKRRHGVDGTGCGLPGRAGRYRSETVESV